MVIALTATRKDRKKISPKKFEEEIDMTLKNKLKCPFCGETENQQKDLRHDAVELTCGNCRQNMIIIH